MLNSEQNPEECDARNDDSSNGDGNTYIINFFEKRRKVKNYMT